MDENLVGGYEFGCAKEVLCTTEDAQSVAGFGDQLRYVVFPRMFMADSESQEF